MVVKISPLREVFRINPGEVNMGTNWNELVDSATMRSEIYGLLSTVFREEPNEVLIRELREPEMSSILVDEKVDLGANFYNEDESIVKEALAIEFARLFIGPESHISAHESVFRDTDTGRGGLWGTLTVEVKSFIEATGLNYDEDFRGIPDHISVELEFMHKLALWEKELYQQKKMEDAKNCQNIQQMFLQQHLLCWANKFFEEVMTRAELPFYKAMAEFAWDYMEFEQDRIKIKKVA